MPAASVEAIGQAHDLGVGDSRQLQHTYETAQVMSLKVALLALTAGG